MTSAESLRCFVAAARTLNFRGAARNVALTPAAFGARIAQLENEFGYALFERTTRRVVLTEQGRALLPRAEAALSALAACSSPHEHAPMELTLGTRHELGLSFVLPLLPKLEKTRANLRIHIHVGSGAELLRRVRSGEIDCAVGSMRTNDPRLDTFALHEETYRFVASPKLLKQNPLARLADAEAHTLIDTDDDLPLYSYWREASAEHAMLRFRGIRKAGTIEAVRALVRSGEGVAVLPTYYVADDIERKELSVVLPRIHVRADQFRLFFRVGDSRAAVFHGLARELVSSPLR